MNVFNKHIPIEGTCYDGSVESIHYDPNCAGASGSEGVKGNKGPCHHGIYETTLV